MRRFFKLKISFLKIDIRVFRLSVSSWGALVVGFKEFVHYVYVVLFVGIVLFIIFPYYFLNSYRIFSDVTSLIFQNRNLPSLYFPGQSAYKFIMSLGPSSQLWRDSCGEKQNLLATCQQGIKASRQQACKWVILGVDPPCLVRSSAPTAPADSLSTAS